MEFPSLSHLSEPNTVDWEIIDSRENWEIAFNLDFFLPDSQRFRVIFGKRHICHKDIEISLWSCVKRLMILFWSNDDETLMEIFVSCNKKIIKAFLCFSCRDVRVMGLPQWSSLCNDRSQCQFFPANFQNKIILKDAIPSFLFSSSLQHKFSNFHGYFSNFQLVNASSVCLQFLYC